LTPIALGSGPGGIEGIRFQKVIVQKVMVQGGVHPRSPQIHCRRSGIAEVAGTKLAHLAIGHQAPQKQILNAQEQLGMVAGNPEG